jgi:hypothetical protein
VRFVITGGERNDVTQTPALISPGRGAQVLCDRGYDADWWREHLLAAAHHPVAPGRRNRCIPPQYDTHAYRPVTSSKTPSPLSNPLSASPFATSILPPPTPPLSLSPVSSFGSGMFEDVP